MSVSSTNPAVTNRLLAFTQNQPNSMSVYPDPKSIPLQPLTKEKSYAAQIDFHPFLRLPSLTKTTRIPDQMKGPAGQVCDLQIPTKQPKSGANSSASSEGTWNSRAAQLEDTLQGWRLLCTSRATELIYLKKILSRIMRNSRINSSLRTASMVIFPCPQNDGAARPCT